MLLVGFKKIFGTVLLQWMISLIPVWVAVIK